MTQIKLRFMVATIFFFCIYSSYLLNIGAAEDSKAPSNASDKNAALHIEGLPDYLIGYLASFDSLYQATIINQHPDIKDIVAKKETIAILLKWLSTQEAWEPRRDEATWGFIRYVRGRIAKNDLKLFREFLAHDLDRIRDASFQVLLYEYWTIDKNKDATILLLQQMLLDRSAMVRVDALNAIKISNTKDELILLLKRIHKNTIGDANRNIEREEYERFLSIKGTEADKGNNKIPSTKEGS